MADTKIYPRGQIALGSGDLLDVVNIRVSHRNNGKLVHTIRQKGVGTTLGTEETEVTFDMVVSEDGAERDYYAAVKDGAVKQVRVKIPGETMTVNGIFTGREIEIPLDDAIKASLTFIGRME